MSHNVIYYVNDDFHESDDHDSICVNVDHDNSHCETDLGSDNSDTSSVRLESRNAISDNDFSIEAHNK